MNNDILRKVRGLLAVAEDPATPEEARNAYVAKFQELMSIHAIDEAMVRAKAKDPSSQPEKREVTLEGQYQPEQRNLLCALAQVNDVQSAYLSKRRGEGQVVYLVGYSEDLDAVDFLFTSLLVQMASAALKVQANAWAREMSGGAATVSFRRSFMHGFADEVVNRLLAAKRAARAEAQATYGSDLLPVLASKTDLVESSFREFFPHITTTKAPGARNAGGYGAGRKAGTTADISNTQVGGSRGAIDA